MRLEELHPAQRLVETMNRIYYGQMTTTSGGNLSIRDKDGSIWITPTSIDKGSLTKDDICHVLPDGTIQGKHKPSVELPFHSHIYKLRPDISAIVHAHPPALVGFSLARMIPSLDLLPDLSSVIGSVRMAKYEVPGSATLGDYIAQEFEAGGDAIMMENHGVVVGKGDITQAFTAFEALDWLGRIQIGASRLGKALPSPLPALPVTDYAIFVRSDTPTQRENDLRKELCTFAKRAYSQRLTSAAYGAWSVRVDEESFLITPAKGDRAALTPDDIVLMRGETAEQGKTPDAAAAFHAQVYKQHPEAMAVAVARPTDVMAYAVTNEAFDARTIPESYIMLRYPMRLPCGSLVLAPAQTAARFTQVTPVALLQNDCFAAMGTSLLNAYDRLEVAQYSAWSLLNCAAVGSAVKINAQQVQKIEQDFHLPT